MRDFSLLYQLTYPLVRYTLKIFYKKIEVKDAHHYPKSGPVLICCTHTNAFMDPILLQTNGGTMRQIYSLARGDAFKKGIMSWLLKQWKLIPIYRISEGYENLAKNNETFERSYEVLERKNSLIMFPEGICVQEKRLRKLKKGAARIALGVEQRNGFNFNIPLLPVCINYQSPKETRTNVFVCYGKPINSKDYVERFKLDKATAINDLTSDLQQAMSELYLHINNKENDCFVEDVLEVYKPELMLKKNLDQNDLEKDFEINKEIVQSINKTEQHNISEMQNVKEAVSTYTVHLKKHEVTNMLLSSKALGQLHWGRTLFDLIVLLVGLPAYLISLATNYPPYKLGYTLANKIAKNVEFNASINVAFSMLGWLIYYGLQLLTVALVFRDWKMLIVYALVVPLTGLFGLKYHPLLKNALARYKLFSLKRNNKTVFEQLINDGNRVMGLLDEIMMANTRKA